MTFVARQTRQTYDRRVENWVNTDCFVFKAAFTDSLSVEYEVNAEFGDEAAARTQAEFYGPPVGQLPKCVRTRVKKVTIHAGNKPYGGGGDGLLIHTGQTAEYLDLGILPETLVHEASHTSLDPVHANSAGWLDAQKKDVEFISTYARDNPTREDVAESFLPVMAVLHKSDRISAAMRQTVLKTIPNRIAYFQGQKFDYGPVLVVTSIAKKRDLRVEARSSLAPGLAGWRVLSTLGRRHIDWRSHARP